VKTLRTKKVSVFLVLLMLLTLSCSRAISEDDAMLQVEINGGESTPPPPPVSGDLLPAGRWSIDEVALGDTLQQLKDKFGEPIRSEEFDSITYHGFPKTTARVGFDAGGRVVEVSGGSLQKDGKRLVDNGHMLGAIPWRVGVEGKLDRRHKRGRHWWSARIETGWTLSFQVPEGGTVSFVHSSESGTTELTLKR
jgi:hypothetical protein